jgi:hypothetical protein
VPDTQKAVLNCARSVCHLSQNIRQAMRVPQKHALDLIRGGHRFCEQNTHQNQDPRAFEANLHRRRWNPLHFGGEYAVYMMA